MSSTIIPFAQTDTTFADDLIIKDCEALAEVACFEPTPAHGLLGFVNLGDTFLAVFFRWRPTMWANDAPTVCKKVPAFVVMLPRSAAPKGSAWDLCLRAQSVRAADDVTATIN